MLFKRGACGVKLSQQSRVLETHSCLKQSEPLLGTFVTYLKWQPSILRLKKKPLTFTHCILQCGRVKKHRGPK